MKKWIIIASLIVSVFSALEIYNYSALWKDQIEFQLYTKEYFKQEHVVKLIDRSIELTWYQGFFAFLLLLSSALLMVLIFSKKKN